ncbi:hypothetical protein IVB30_32130 [Bradyrhizobium sp. 200]|uniref:hypothetical protein n=1 Tax=Bradyrhizobium sp. 200 TaxID=2782665 RepID=UPI001FFFB7C8|nr:hypothetical protein [Bradyrhizobium sp. 200]UPJ47819.1 hypothetical protein IVB30_32130 [Bradyrhizobium sp. 200]
MDIEHAPVKAFSDSYVVDMDHVRRHQHAAQQPDPVKDKPQPRADALCTAAFTFPTNQTRGSIDVL